MSGLAIHLVAVCFSDGADVAVWRVEMDDEQRRRLTAVLTTLITIGHVAAFAIDEERHCSWLQLVDGIAGRVGEFVIDACTASSPPEMPMPAFVMPIWPFDHEIGEAPAATAQFLGLDLEVTAIPSSDEELGVSLPGRGGRWLIHARPMF